jgi:hypothetical protein
VKLWSRLNLLALAACFLMLGARCQQSPQADDESDIRTLLGTSDYTNDDHSGATDDETNDPQGNGFEPGSDNPLVETLPWVRFARKIERPVPRTLNIAIPAYPGYPETTALATITAEPTGDFYVHNDSNRHVTWVKPIADQGVRKVYLTKHNDTWRIREMTPWGMSTKNPAYGISIAAVRLAAAPSGLSYEYTSPETMLTKNQLPAFLPGDTVHVTVTVQSDSATWAFLHRGVRGHHRRQAFYRTGASTFERRWVVRDDSLPRIPAVRPTAIDIIGDPALFGDTLTPYNSCAWTLPYVVISTPDAVRP